MGAIWGRDSPCHRGEWGDIHSPREPLATVFPPQQGMVPVDLQKLGRAVPEPGCKDSTRTQGFTDYVPSQGPWHRGANTVTRGSWGNLLVNLLIIWNRLLAIDHFISITLPCGYST